MGNLGDTLRDARQRLKLSLDDVESATRIRKKYLIALEQEDFVRLPALIYARGFARTYAVFLGLDADAIADEVPDSPEPTSLEPALHVTKEPRAIGSWLVVALILAIVGAVGFYLYQQGLAMPVEPEVAVIEILTPTAVPTTTPSPVPTKVLVSTVELQVRALQTTWISVTLDSQAAFAGTLQIGDNHAWTSREKIGLRIGNAGGLEVTANGTLPVFLGRPGEVLEAEVTLDGVKITSANPSAGQPTPARSP
ncbi:MAG: DUF4115 domain-containing protein [Dehalococcoidia bacterium]|nr:DUF4115 domain-containing protein [Dehalococcoidia bacterium]